MRRSTDRLDIRLSAEDKHRITEAAALSGVPVAAFVRDAALRKAMTTIGSASEARANGLAARLRGRATEGMTTDDVMRLTRDA